MGRGAQAQTMQMTDQQLANQNAMNRALYDQGQSLSNTAAGGYQSLLANPGYTPAQQSAINNESLGALSSAFGALAQSAANRTARTRNSAGYGDLLDELARDQGRQSASVAQQNQFGFANQAKQDQLAGLQGLSGLYGVNNSLLGRTLGIPGQLLSTRTSLANAPGFGTSFAQALGGTLGGGLAGLGIGRLNRRLP
jgi:hypothetical protein